MWTIYQHHKGMHYLALGNALHSENMEPHTIYLALYDNPRGGLWARPCGMFFDNGGPRGSKRFIEIARLRPLALNEASSVLPFGYDAWGEGRTLEDFVKSYEANKNHLRGQRYVLEDLEGQKLSTVNTLRFHPELTGLAWLATDPEKRKNGHAALLIQAVMALLRHEEKDMGFVLHSEIGIRFYEKFGFVKAPVENQNFEKSIAMLAGNEELFDKHAAVFSEFF